jgi:hypothetical protein
MTWAAIAAEARRTGTSRQRRVQAALDAIRWAAKQAGGLTGSTLAKIAHYYTGSIVLEALKKYRVRHFFLHHGTTLSWPKNSIWLGSRF